MKGGRQLVMDENGCALLSERVVDISSNQKIAMKGSFEKCGVSGLWYIPLSQLLSPDEVHVVADSNAKDDYLLWHARFAHHGPCSMAHIIQHRPSISSLTHLSPHQLNKRKENSATVALKRRVRASLTRSLYLRTLVVSERIIASDICRPFKRATYDGKRFLCLYIDFFTERWFVFCIAKKSEQKDSFKRLHKSHYLNRNIQVGIFFSNHGGEYKDGDFQKNLLDSNI